MGKLYSYKNMGKLYSYKNMGKLYSIVKELTPNPDIYFEFHSKIIAKQCKNYAKILGANEIICEMAGLFHDIGYAKTYSHENDHIINGMNITKKILLEQNYDKEIINRVVDCIKTHDGNLIYPSPLENIIVNDVDAINLFKQPKKMFELFTKRFNKNEDEAKKILLEHGKETFELIYSNYFKKIAKPLYLKYIKYFDNL